MIDINRIEAEHQAAVRGVLQRFFAHVKNPWPGDEAFAEYFARSLANEERYALFGAFEEGNLVGIVSAALVDSSFGFRPFLWIDDLFVESDARGRGIGGRLIERAAAHARSGGCTGLLLGAAPHDGASLYERAGFVPMGGELLVKPLDATT